MYDMKKLTSFRLSEMTKQNLKYLAKKHQLSQAELIEVLCNFAERNEFNFQVAAKAYKTEHNPAFIKFKAEYEKLNREDQKAVWQKLMESGFDFSRFDFE